MLQISRNIILKEVEKVKVPYEFLTDFDCVKLLDSTLSDLTDNQIHFNDIRDKLLQGKLKFGNDKEIGTYVLWVDFKNKDIIISIFKVDWLYFLTKE